MTLLLTAFAAVATTIVWYSSDKARALNLGTLALAFWGASLMWLVDAVAEYSELGSEYFTPSAADMLNDAYLGLSVIALALVAWTAAVLVKDPNHVVQKILVKK